MKDYVLKSMEDRKVLVTGGLGFVGSNLVLKLVSLGANITIFTHTLNKLINVKEVEDRVEIVQGDIVDFEKVSESVKGKDIVFHLAGQISHIDSMADPFLDIEVNCRGTMNVLESCRRFNDDAKVVFAGTRGEVGKPVSNPVDENHRDDPLDIYAADKLAAEKYCKIYYHVYGIPTTTLRLTNVFGPRQQMRHGKYGVLNYFIRRAMLDEPILIYGDGSTLRDYNYVENVVDAFILAAQSEKADGEVFLVGSNRGTSLKELVELIIKTVGKGTYKLVPYPDNINRRLEIGDFVVNYSKINKLLGWYPKISLEEGLKRTVEFYRQRLEEYI
jgi:nucleoside-diphosphate-sugar epimerase